MNVGTKSLLFGVHQFIWHPLTVLLAWRKLYGWPSWRELVCIAIHDWGYWGSPSMDGPEGERHPEFGARLAGRILGPEYARLCLYHSRHYTRQYNDNPSRLCWADKMSIAYDPRWFYLWRARLSGELNEYRQLATAYVPISASDQEWFDWISNRFQCLSREQRGDAVPYINPLRTK